MSSRFASLGWLARLLALLAACEHENQQGLGGRPDILIVCGRADRILQCTQQGARYQALRATSVLRTGIGSAQGANASGVNRLTVTVQRKPTSRQDCARADVRVVLGPLHPRKRPSSEPIDMTN